MSCKPFANNDEDWTFMSEEAAKAVRWLGVVPFEKIETPDVVQIAVAACLANQREFTPRSKCDAVELSLDAHVSSFVAKNRMPAARSPSRLLNDRHSAGGSH